MSAYQVKAYGASDSIFNGLKPMQIERRAPQADEVHIEAETQQVLEFCAAHGIAPEIELIDMQDINQAFDKMNDEDVRFRYIIDMASLREVSLLGGHV